MPEVLQRQPVGPMEQVAVLLHGRGSDEEDLFDLAGMFGPNTRVFSLRAPYPFGPGYAWFGMDSGGHPHLEQMRESVAMLDQFLDETADGCPAILLGFSQGGLMACATAAFREGRGIRAVATLSAPPMPDVPPGEPLKDLPIFWGHGTEDPVVPWERGQRTLAVIHELGAEVTARQYAMGHTLSQDEMTDLVHWLRHDLRPETDEK